MSTVVEHPSFSPGLRAEDPWASHWIRQVTTRLRREICWRLHERDGGPATAARPAGNPLSDSLDLTRYWDAKRRFFATDVTARYLSDKLETAPPRGEPVRGSFGWVVRTLDLDDLSAFALALTCAAAFDNAAGAVVAACLSDAGRTQPTLALAQRLWDRPDETLRLADPAHPLWRYGLLHHGGAASGSAGVDWDAPIATAPLIVSQLLFPDAPAPQVLEPLDAADGGERLRDVARPIVARLVATPADTLRVVPVLGGKGAPLTEMVRAIGEAARREVRRIAADAALLDNAAYFRSLATLAWLRGFDLYLEDDAAAPAAGERRRRSSALSLLRSIPLTVYVAIDEPGDLAALPRAVVLPVAHVPRLTYAERVECWRSALGPRAPALDGAIAECARRFRYEKETVRALGHALRGLGGGVTAADLVAACRAEVPLEAGDLAQEVVPRFAEHELVLPPGEQRQLEEIHRAMRSLTEVHYGWGTGRVWGESGISVLFAGPPGTGKTMAAEVLAAKLDLPMYRIDLSQVVNKYIGETEKNLKRLFDVADCADTILFFDECDALFGRRTEVRDAHDRYANLEVSYLLERMERFKGLAILATNRRKDIDDAFLRRLRYVVEFPLPDAAQRRAIWAQVVPEKVDVSEVDFDFLARQFQLAGGHIRSIVFNACLQTADAARGAHGAPRLTMERIVVAVKREYDKLDRSVTLEQFGRYAPVVEALARG